MAVTGCVRRPGSRSNICLLLRPFSRGGEEEIIDNAARLWAAVSWVAERSSITLHASRYSAVVVTSILTAARLFSDPDL